MPFGAHETLEVNEILLEKVNMITHFTLYAQAAKNPRLVDMIRRHQQEEIRTYDEIVAYTHDYNSFKPVPPQSNLRGVTPEQIQYGVNEPPQMQPQSNAQMTDREVAIALLLCHKNASMNGLRATLECADPNLRQMLLNSCANCVNQAYEVFLFLNELNEYQVPEMQSHIAKEFLHRYQPTGQQVQSQYGQARQGAGQPWQGAGNPGQTYGYGNQTAGYAAQTSGYGGQTGYRVRQTPSRMPTGSNQSTLYGNRNNYGVQ